MNIPWLGIGQAIPLQPIPSAAEEPAEEAVGSDPRGPMVNMQKLVLDAASGAPEGEGSAASSLRRAAQDTAQISPKAVELFGRLSVEGKGE
jgi:hypothetical protein